MLFLIKESQFGKHEDFPEKSINIIQGLKKFLYPISVSTLLFPHFKEML